MAESPAAADFVDVHYHAGADLYRRRHGVLEAGRRYAAAGGWVVVKSHLGSTAAQAWEARQEGLPVSGSVTLNHIAGGLDPRVVEQAVYQHGESPARLIAHLPTLTGEHASKLTRTPFHPLLDVSGLRRLRVSTEDGSLSGSTREVMRAVRDLPVVLATGHADRAEILRVVEEAVRLDLDRVLLTHPTHPMCGLTDADLADLAGVEQVYVELTSLTRLLGHHDGQRFGTVLRGHPRVVHSSDLGQPGQPDVVEWREICRAWLAEAELDERQVAAVSHGNPSELLAPSQES